MNRVKISRHAHIVVLALLPFLCLTENASAQTETIDNDRVVELVNAGIADSVLLPKIRISRVFLDASEEGLLRLKKAGVSDEIVVAMMERASVDGYIANDSSFDRQELRSGAEIRIVTTEKISGKSAREGQKVVFKVAQDLKIDDAVVIARESPVAAVVSRARKPGMAGRGGQLSISLTSTTAVDGQTIRLRAAKSGAGGDNFGTALTLSYFMGVGLLIPGKNATITAGTEFTAYVDETRFIAVRKSDK